MAGFDAPTFSNEPDLSIFNPTNRVGSSPLGIPFAGVGSNSGAQLASTDSVIATDKTTSTTVGTDAGTTTSTTTSTVNNDVLGHWLGRIAVIVLGFGFVIVGLTMFRHGVNVQEAVRRTGT